MFERTKALQFRWLWFIFFIILILSGDYLLMELVNWFVMVHQINEDIELDDTLKEVQDVLQSFFLQVLFGTSSQLLVNYVWGIVLVHIFVQIHLWLQFIGV